jgi:hypothetical protein
MVKKFGGKKDACIPIAIGTHGTLQNLRIKNLIPYQKIGGLMFYKYDDIIILLDGDKQSKSISVG